jgi:hypothetical protein
MVPVRWAPVFGAAVAVRVAPEAPVAGLYVSQAALDEADHVAWLVVTVTCWVPPAATVDQVDGLNDTEAGTAGCVTVNATAVAAPAVTRYETERAEVVVLASAVTEKVLPCLTKDHPVGGVPTAATSQLAWFVVTVTVPATPPACPPPTRTVDTWMVGGPEAWVTAMVRVSPPALTVTVAVRAAPVFGAAVRVSVVPDAPGAAVSHAASDTGVHPAWFVVTRGAVVPPLAGAAHVVGETVSVAAGPWAAAWVTEIVVLAAPAVTWTVPDRAAVPVLGATTIANASPFAPDAGDTVTQSSDSVALHPGWLVPIVTVAVVPPAGAATVADDASTHAGSVAVMV